MYVYKVIIGKRGTVVAAALVRRGVGGVVDYNDTIDGRRFRGTGTLCAPSRRRITIKQAPPSKPRFVGVVRETSSGTSVGLVPVVRVTRNASAMTPEHMTEPDINGTHPSTGDTQ